MSMIVRAQAEGEFVVLVCKTRQKKTAITGFANGTERKVLPIFVGGFYILMAEDSIGRVGAVILAVSSRSRLQLLVTSEANIGNS